MKLSDANEQKKQRKMQDVVMNKSNIKADLTPNKMTSTKESVEKRSVKILSNVKPSEKEIFISLIGRKSESDVVRELILSFIKNKKLDNEVG